MACFLCEEVTKPTRRRLLHPHQSVSSFSVYEFIKGIGIFQKQGESVAVYACDTCFSQVEKLMNAKNKLVQLCSTTMLRSSLRDSHTLAVRILLTPSNSTTIGK